MLAAALLLAAAPLLASFLITVLAFQRLDGEVVRAWAGIPFPIAPGPEPANEAAIRLEERAQVLDIGLSPEGSGRPHPYREQSEEQKEVTAWLKVELAWSGPLRPPPVAVRHAMALRRAAIDDLVNTVEASELPVWEGSLGLTMEGGNLLAQLRLQETLCAAALVTAAEGEAARGLAIVGAAWKLNQNLYSRHELIANLIAIAASRYHLGALRKIDGVSPDWLDRAPPVSGRRAIQRGLAGDATFLLSASRQRGARGAFAVMASRGPANRAQQVFYTLASPWIRYIGADAARALAALAHQAPSYDACADVAADTESYRAAQPPWGLRTATVVGPEVLARGASLDLDQELTRLVIAAKAARTATGIPPPLPSPGTCVNCPEREWRFVARSDGGIRIALAGPPPWRPKTGLFLPVSYDDVPRQEEVEEDALPNSSGGPSK